MSIEPSGRPPTRIDAGVGLDESKEEVRGGRLAGAGRPDECDDAAIGDDQVEPVEGGRRSARIRDGDPGEDDLGLGRDRDARPRPRRPATPVRHRLVEHREDPLGDRPPFRARVIAHRERPQRQEELGDDDQDGQRPFELDRAVHQPQAHLDRDQRHGDRRAPLQDERRLEGRPQHVHRRVAVSTTDGADVLDLLGTATEHLQRRQAAEHVQEERAEIADLGKSPFGDRARPAADDRQQQDQDRAGEEQDQRRRRIDQDDSPEHQERDCDREGSGRLVGGDVRVQRIDHRRR